MSELMKHRTPTGGPAKPQSGRTSALPNHWVFVVPLAFLGASIISLVSKEGQAEGAGVALLALAAVTWLLPSLLPYVRRVSVVAAEVELARQEREEAESGTTKAVSGLIASEQGLRSVPNQVGPVLAMLLARMIEGLKNEGIVVVDKGPSGSASTAVASRWAETLQEAFGHYLHGGVSREAPADSP